jgi:hypothetical protein
MKLYEILGICILILIGVGSLKYLGNARFTSEGFTSGKSEPSDYVAPSKLSPDVKEEGPAHLLKDKIEITRPLNMFGTLTQQQCYEQDGINITAVLGDYNQRTNNYVHTYPDSCSAPYKELVGSFYAPREGAIGSPVPKGLKYPESSKCEFGQ